MSEMKRGEKSLSVCLFVFRDTQYNLKKRKVHSGEKKNVSISKIKKDVLNF